jgi:hypothetical protein
MNLKERITDPGYQKVLGEMIDDFFKAAGDTELCKVFLAEAPSDMVEIMIRYFNDKPDIEKSLVTMFVLGVYMANKNVAVLPSEVQ